MDISIRFMFKIDLSRPTYNAMYSYYVFSYLGFYFVKYACIVVLIINFEKIKYMLACSFSQYMLFERYKLYKITLKVGLRDVFPEEKKSNNLVFVRPCGKLYGKNYIHLLHSDICDS